MEECDDTSSALLLRQQVSLIISETLLCHLSLILPCRLCGMESHFRNSNLLREFDRGARRLITSLFYVWSGLVILFNRPFLLANGILYAFLGQDQFSHTYFLLMI